MLEYATCAELYNYPDKPAPQGAIPIPEVAAGFPKLSADGRTQTIRLKRTFRFDSGGPVTAANFVAALNRDASPRLESSATSYMHDIVGADAVIAGWGWTRARRRSGRISSPGASSCLRARPRSSPPNTLLPLQPRPASLQGAGQIPLAEALNWAVDRRAMVAARGYLGGKRTDQILPAAMTRPAALYALGSLDIAGACKK